MTLLTSEQTEKLKSPFDPKDVSWKPQTVNYNAETALAVAYADPRCYIDRLNEVFGIGGWSDNYHFLATPFTKFIKGKKAWKDTPATEDKLVPGNKVVCVATITIHTKDDKTYERIEVSSTGDSDASDDNAATSAEAQAFKRAAMKLGIGRYLYELPKVTARFKNGSWLDGPPSLPDWAMPAIVCEECTKHIESVVHGDKTFSVSQLTKNSQTKYHKNLCATCQRAKTVEIKDRLDRVA